MAEAADRKESVLLRTDQLDMRQVASILQYRTLWLQLKSKRMTAVPLDEANAIWPLGDLMDLTGHAGTEADAFLFSGESAETGVLFMATLKALPLTLLGPNPLHLP